MSERRQSLADDYSPIASSTLKKWLNFWLVGFMTGLAISLGLALARSFPAWGWRELALTIMVGAQAVLYLMTFVFVRRWPLPWWRLALHFFISIGLWVIEVQLNSTFFWIIGMYLGQMTAVLPPRAAIPGIILVFLVAGVAADIGRGLVGFLVDLRETQNLFAFLSAMIAVLVLYAYIYSIASTSQERARLIGELQDAQSQLEQARQQEAELAVLRERERLARDLHDGLGHALAALSVQLEAIQRLYPVDPQQASARVDEMKKLARDSMDSLRRSLAGLRAAELGEQSLSLALQSLCVNVSQHIGAEIVCTVAGMADELGPALAEAIWRVTQEALTNVAKHAQAHHVDVKLELHPQTVILKVADDGVGIPSDVELKPGHYGLQGMRERVEGLGGSLTLLGNEHGGTLVEARFPLITTPA